MLAGLPITERRLDIGGAETTVLEAGDGPPLLLLHGGIECGGAYWAPVITRLVERHRLVVPDVPGLGESAPVDRLDDDTFAAWFAGVLDQTHCVHPTLVAHSLLGSMAARMVATRGDRVRSFVVYGAPGVGPYQMPMRLRYVAIRFGIRPSARNAERFDRFALLDLDANRRRDPEWFAAFDAYARSQATLRHVKRTMSRLIATETKQIPDAGLRRIAVPTTMLWGRHDRMVPLALAQGAADRLGWPLRVVDGAAHAPHMEQPEAFAAELSAIADAPSERSA
jgi:pimeloyl-ACP methyl ester carboxylesterase